MISVFQLSFFSENPPLRTLAHPSLRVLFESLLSAAPLGVPNAVAFAPLGYAVRFRPTLLATPFVFVRPSSLKRIDSSKNSPHTMPHVAKETSNTATNGERCENSEITEENSNVTPTDEPKN
ncbi:MAG: hypothetical protein RL189_2809 [Pseudomonadota bacterium]